MVLSTSQLVFLPTPLGPSVASHPTYTHLLLLLQADAKTSVSSTSLAEPSFLQFRFYRILLPSKKMYPSVDGSTNPASLISASSVSPSPWSPYAISALLPLHAVRLHHNTHMPCIYCLHSPSAQHAVTFRKVRMRRIYGCGIYRGCVFGVQVLLRGLRRYSSSSFIFHTSTGNT